MLVKGLLTVGPGFVYRSTDDRPQTRLNLGREKVLVINTPSKHCRVFQGTGFTGHREKGERSAGIFDGGTFQYQ